MLASLKQMKSRLVRVSADLGGYRIAKWLTRHQPRILMYHRFSAEKKRGYMDVLQLRQQLQLLKTEFTVLSLSEVADALEHQLPLPKNTIVLTVDDGYADFYQYAFPEFRAAGVPVSFFVTSGFVDGKTWLWPDMLTALIDNIDPIHAVWPKNTPSELVAGLKHCNDKRAVWHPLNRFLMPMALQDKFVWLQQAAELNQYKITRHAPSAYKPVTWEQLKEMAASGIVDIGAHTVMHPTLSGLPMAEAISEVTESRTRLETQLGIKVKNFCYPNGQPEDFSPALARAVADAGFDCAVAAHCYYVTLHDRFSLPRFAVTPNPFQFKKIIYGVQWLSKRLTQSRQLKRIEREMGR
ncbi:polysaccharide deacetylase family protein [Corallincola spongiicola]|uniref:NodB homology domain-containing protein n=1 Tax=Corallincola spongiicola TaxID=2520508 RepID=A0ABY1WPZ6_9GAMM|nr:polysaccharide deacetylase family protein [Corallincola spongiicola]TAA46795.1 hypothetical protein EXY25_05950 [Corallincola spongiicola]